MKMSNIIPVVLVTSFVSGVVGGVLGLRFVEPNFGAKEQNKPVAETYFLEESSTISAIDKVAPAVVSIAAYKDVPVGSPVFSFDNLFFGQSDPFRLQTQQPSVKFDYKQVSGGTGFIVTKEGLVITNKHVVQDTEADFRVILDNEKQYKAEVISRDPFDDVAVLRILSESPIMKDAEGKVIEQAKLAEVLKFPYVKFGNSDALQVGQQVLAIGNALAQYENTVTSGIISAKGRDVSAYNDAAGAVENLSGLIQTDASINFGNSGGPLINLKGELVGMNVAVAQSANGIGFAIPANDLKPILASIEKYGKIVRPALGVRFVTLTETQAKELDVAIDHGAILVAPSSNEEALAVLPGGPAAKAGLKALDVILEVDGKVVDESQPLQKLVRSYAPDDKIRLKVWRAGETFEVDVILKSSEDLK